MPLFRSQIKCEQSAIIRLIFASRQDYRMASEHPLGPFRGIDRYNFKLPTMTKPILCPHGEADAEVFMQGLQKQVRELGRVHAMG